MTINFYSSRKRFRYCLKLFILTVVFTYFLILCTHHIDVHEERVVRKFSRMLLAKQISLAFSNVEDTKQVKLEHDYGTSLVRDLYVAGFSAVGGKVCPNFGTELRLLIVVVSHPSSKYQRIALRRTWGTIALRKDISIAFLLGVSDEVPKAKIRKELELYEDLIITNNADSYQNLTLKSISILEYVSTHCNSVKFILKVDDDVYVHTNLLLKILTYLDVQKRGIYGKAIKNVGPIREKTSKYYVSWNYYKKSLYPYYMNGPAYLFPAHISKEMYIASFQLSYIPMEDVFITGILAEYLNITRYENKKFRIIDMKNEAVREEMIFFHRATPSSQFVLWYLLHKPAPKKIRFAYTRYYLKKISSLFRIGY